MELSKKKIIGLSLAGILALSSTSIFTVTGGPSFNDVKDAQNDFDHDQVMEERDSEVAVGISGFILEQRETRNK
ncbi:hypothetical protein JCM10914A_46290 [Paenibacillus sp. JCM 10914]|uniref:hypothetical protein n=1 Tax=Paenibacillus sp. JCM 10914 TaxID=1236974 RepID=UPI0003CC4E52|nr:hypothetical protein [Paenibacillus sp. JCM 10914]GAE08772.1 hypothetical protein JCM10914_5104 [Paenibacillus sp. JCM 10914]